jgi:hypothetical protein
MFVAKIDPAGQILWTKTFPLEWTGNGGGIALSSNETFGSQEAQTGDFFCALRVNGRTSSIKRTTAVRHPHRCCIEKAGAFSNMSELIILFDGSGKST